MNASVCNNWRVVAQLHKLMPGSVPSDRFVGDACGTSVAMEGSTLAFGCPGHDFIAPDGGVVMVYLYDAMAGAWQQHQRIHHDLSLLEDRSVTTTGNMHSYLLPALHGA